MHPNPFIILMHHLPHVPTEMLCQGYYRCHHVIFIITYYSCQVNDDTVTKSRLPPLEGVKCHNPANGRGKCYLQAPYRTTCRPTLKKNYFKNQYIFEIHIFYRVL